MRGFFLFLAGFGLLAGSTGAAGFFLLLGAIC